MINGEDGLDNENEDDDDDAQWACERCTLLNPSSEATCSACFANRPSNSRSNGYGSHNENVQNAVPDEEQQGSSIGNSEGWVCSSCTLLNAGTTASCVACGGTTRRHDHEDARHQTRDEDDIDTTGEPESSWPCSRCTFMNPNERSTCEVCSSTRPTRSNGSAGDNEHNNNVSEVASNATRSVMVVARVRGRRADTVLTTSTGGEACPRRLRRPKVCGECHHERVSRNDGKHKQSDHGITSKGGDKDGDDDEYHDDWECAICLDAKHEQGSNEGDDRALAILECKHEFHRGCINQWKLRSDECPICRGPVNEVQFPSTTTEVSTTSVSEPVASPSSLSSTSQRRNILTRVRNLCSSIFCGRRSEHGTTNNGQA